MVAHCGKHPHSIKDPENKIKRDLEKQRKIKGEKKFLRRSKRDLEDAYDYFPIGYNKGKE